MKNKKEEYITYLSPEYIYVPYSKLENLRIKKNKLVYNNMYLGDYDDGTKIYSPVSGRIIGIKDMDYITGKKSSLVIENDYIDRKEKLNYSKNVKKLKKNEIIESLTNYGLNKKIDSKTILVVSSSYDKKYDLKSMFINYEFYEEILEGIDEFMDIFNMKNCYICLNKTDFYSIGAYEKYINAFPNICIVYSDKKFKDNKCVFYDVEEILAIYKAIHLNYLYDTTMITIYDKESIVVKVKVDSSLYELLRALKISLKDKKVLVNNNVISDVKNFVIDINVKSIIIK